MKLFFILLMIAAYLGSLWWRGRISRKQKAFKTKLDLASDEEHAKRLRQEALKRQGK